MNAYTLLLAESLLSFGMSALVLLALSKPLLNTLIKVCPDAQAAAFWLSFTRILLVLAPFLLVLMVDAFSRHGDPLDTLRFALMAIVTGLLAGLWSIGKQLGQFVLAPEKAGSAR